MKYQKFGDRYVVRLEKGEELIETLTGFLSDQSIASASFSAAGAVKSLKLGYWNAETKSYEYREWDEQLEIVSFQGNASFKEGEPFLHLHGVFGRRDFSVIGGHIKKGVVYPTLEVWISAENIPVRRTKDEESGLDVLDLPETAGVR